MERETTTPGQAIGWAFGLVGFVVSVLVGRLIDAGVGYVLFMVVLWAGLGALFAFLVERSAVEEHDRAEELRHTRLATLAPAPEPGRERETPEDRRARREAARRAADELAAAQARRADGTDPRPVVPVTDGAASPDHAAA